MSFFVSSNSLYFKVCFVYMSIATSTFFYFPFAWNTFFHPLTFSLYVSLVLMWASCRQHIYRSRFCIHSASRCLLVGAFNPITFKVIIDMYILITILLIVLDLFCRSFFFPFSFVLPSCVLCIYFPCVCN